MGGGVVGGSEIKHTIYHMLMPRKVIHIIIDRLHSSKIAVHLNKIYILLGNRFRY